MDHSVGRDFDPSTITGSISDDIKRAFANMDFTAMTRSDSIGFGASIMKRLKVVEVSVKEKADEPKKPEARVIVEVDVTEDMLNGAHTVHGGCSAYLVDLCSTLAINALHMANTGNLEHPFTVSQSLNIVYHAPATLGERLRIINTTLTLGARALTARAEIWSATHHRLIASGTHVKMFPVARSKM